jgi:hypothetical protein
MLVLLLAVAACQPAEVDPAFDEAEGAKLLAVYEAARADGDFEIAEARGDELRQRHGETEAAATMRKSIEDVRAQAEKMRENRRLLGLWEYQKIPVAGGIQNTAALYSRVEVDPESEVKAQPDARLILRRHPEWGESAYLVLAQQALQCGPPCVMQIRFDDGEPQRYTGDPADTGTGPALFIEDRDRFLEAMTQAQRVRIELPRSGHLVPVFEFEVGGFLPRRHLED